MEGAALVLAGAGLALLSALGCLLGMVLVSALGRRRPRRKEDSP